MLAERLTDILTTTDSFEEFDLAPTVLQAIRDLGYIEPTPIQTLVIPLMIEGRDVVGQAQTGTGKTAAFGIPIAMRVNPALRQTQAVVLVPTRQLAIQGGRDLEALRRGNRLTRGHLVGRAPGRPLLRRTRART